MNLVTISMATFSVAMFVLLVRDIFRHVTGKKQCPICRNQHPDRVKRAAWAKSMQFLIDSEGYRCHRCGNRFLRIGRSTAKASAEATAP